MKQIEYKKNIYNEEDSGKAYLFTLIIPIVFGLIVSIVLNLIGSAFGLKAFSDSPALYSIYLVLVNGCLLGIYFLYNKFGKVNFKKASLLSFKLGRKNILFSILIALITLFGSLYLINYLMDLMSKIGYNPDSSLPLPLTNGGWLVLNIVVLAVIPAICEEFLYRGIIYNGLRKFGSVGAIFLSAIMFALAHGSAMQFFYQFILGLVLAAIVYKTGSIVASMIAHFVNNATVVIYNYIEINTGVSIQAGFTPLVIGISFLVAMVAGVLIWLLLKFMKDKTKKEKLGEELEKTQNQAYNETYVKGEKKFSSKSSVLFFALSLAVAVALWAIGTFAG